MARQAAEQQLVVKCAEKAASRGLNEVSSDPFSGAVGINDKEAGSATAVEEKEDLSATAVDEKEDGRVTEEVAVAHRYRLEKGVVLLHKSTMELLRCDEQDCACVASLDQLATVAVQNQYNKCLILLMLDCSNNNILEGID